MSERARALEQALRMLIDAAVQTACKIAEDGDRRWHVVDLVCATNDAEKLLAVDPPPSGASPQAETSRCAETCGLLRCRLNEGHSGLHQVYNAATGDFQQFIGQPAPVSPVEPTTCPKCRSNTRAYRLAVADVIDGRMAGMTSCRDEWHSRMPMVSPVEPEPTTTCHCLDCEPLTNPGPKPSEDDINRLEKAAWDSKTDRVLVWYRDRAEMFSQRLRETERAWQLDRKKSTVEPEPCVWRDISSAPKDETPVRLKWAGTTVEAIGRWCPAQVLPSGFGRPNYSDDWRDVEGDDVLLMPTHWKPVSLDDSDEWKLLPALEPTSEDEDDDEVPVAAPDGAVDAWSAPLRKPVVPKILSTDDFYALLRILEVLPVADPFLTDLQSKLSAEERCQHGNRASHLSGPEFVREIERIEALIQSRLPAPVSPVEPTPEPPQDGGNPK